MGLVLAMAASANLITDGDFEAPDASAWTYVSAGWGSGYAWSTESGGNPGEGAELTWGSGGGNGSQALLQTFNAPGGVSTLEISWDWANVAAGGNGWYEVLLLNGTGASWDGPAAGELIAKEEYGFGTDNNNPSWHAGSASVPVTPGGQYTIGLKAGGNPAGTNSAHFDNVRVIPEPGTVLLGVAGLAFLIRRRRR
jgi:hypothetical protein